MIELDDADATHRLHGLSERGRCRRCCAASRRRCSSTTDLTRRRSRGADRARQRQLQPLAGGADLCDAAAAALDRGDPRRRAGRIRAGLRRGAAAASLADAASDPAFAAQVLTLPGEADIAREIGRDVDPDAIHRGARGAAGRPRAGARRPAARLYDALADDGALFARCGQRPGGAPCATPRSISSRPATGSHGRRAGRRRSSRPPTNMTDRLAALGVLCAHAGRRARRGARRLLRDASRDEPLVIDKWFALQAVHPEAGRSSASAG